MTVIYHAELEAALKALPTRKMEAFCRFYFIDLHGTQAARDAGYKGNDVTLASVGYENLIKPQIVSVMELFFERRANEIDISASVIEREYWKLFQLCMNEGNRSVARSCLKDLGEHHAMFIKVVATAEASELAARLASGRSRMNVAADLRASGDQPAPVAVE